MLEIEHLFLQFKQKIVLQDLSLQVQTGTIHGLVGLNGSGKTSLFNVIFGLLTPQSGTISYDQQPLKSNLIAYLETHNYFYSYLTGKEYLSLFQLHNKAFNITKWNEIFLLPLNQLIENYSTGMKKKLAFMAILCLDKPILLLDEPFNGLDMETNQQMKMIIKQLKERQKTILITSHIMESLTSICDSITYLKDGKVEFTAPKMEFEGIEQKIFNEQDHAALINNLLEK
jgi:ABC-2 type transport system ATP-binding protein